jgi:hypothetical protein
LLALSWVALPLFASGAPAAPGSAGTSPELDTHYLDTHYLPLTPTISRSRGSRTRL